MPLAHVRVCQRCDSIRWAPCSTTCRTPLDTDPQSWRINLQHGAGELIEEDGLYGQCTYNETEEDA